MKNLDELRRELKAIQVEDEDDIDKITTVLEENGIKEYITDCDIAFESPGIDVYYYAVSFIYNGELALVSGIFESC